MTVIGEIHASLDAIGPEQQACMFALLVSYPLTLGALLEARGRRMAAGASALSVAGFAVFTNPWFHAVLLAALGIGIVGLLVAAVYVVDRIARHYAFRGLPIEEVEFVDDDSIVEPETTPPTPGRQRLPIVAIVSVKQS